MTAVNCMFGALLLGMKLMNLTTPELEEVAKAADPAQQFRQHLLTRVFNEQLAIHTVPRVSAAANEGLA